MLFLQSQGLLSGLVLQSPLGLFCYDHYCCDLMGNVMENHILITEKTVKWNRELRSNQRASKKLEKRTGFFDFRTKLYKLVRLDCDELLDLSDEGSLVGSKAVDIPSDPKAILERIASWQIIGMGGAGFPAIDKIRSLMASIANEKTLIINAVQCDPALLHDEWLLTNRWDEVAAGITAICRCIKFNKIVVASRQSIKASLADISVNVEFAQLDYFYPMGEEHVLINQLLGLKLENKDRPTEHGVVVFNIQTILNIGQAAANIQSAARYLTVADLTRGTGKIVKAAIGDDAVSVIHKALGINDKATTFIGNGMMNSREIGECEAITALTGSVIYAKPIKFNDPMACVDCGKCQKRCPFNLPIGGLIKAIKYGLPIAENVVKTCVGCNSCAYFCKAGINTTSYIRNNLK